MDDDDVVAVVKIFGLKVIDELGLNIIRKEEEEEEEESKYLKVSLINKQPFSFLFFKNKQTKLKNEK